MMGEIPDVHTHALDCIARCRGLACHSEEPGFTTRTFLSAPMREVHADLGTWMQECGMSVRVDAAGNLRGSFAAQSGDAATLFIGSHLDTVPHAGAFDGILGVVIAVKLVELVRGRQLSFAIEVVGFSEEEGVRFGFPFIGSRALIGELDESLLTKEDAQGISVAAAISAFGLDLGTLHEAVAQATALGFLEFHIEQGPVLESLGRGLGVVEMIIGQTRMEFTFEGSAGHAGTTPMHLRRDALSGAAEWIMQVEREAIDVKDLVATVGRIQAHPGAPNVIAGRATATLDVRHANDQTRRDAVERLVAHARHIASNRNLRVTAELRLDQPAVAMDAKLTDLLARAVEKAGHTPHRLPSGAGHDAMIIAKRMPAAMLFLPSPRGLSHHPDESVLVEDVAAALSAGMNFLEELERGL